MTATSAAGSIGCPACADPVRFVVNVGPHTRQACGRHLGWLIDRMVVGRHVATVRRLETSPR